MKTLPKGQYQVNKWPVLTVGADPKINLDNWEFKITGEVENPITLNWEEFLKLPAIEITLDIHCVTTWSLLGSTWKGVQFKYFLDLVKPKTDATYALQKSSDSINYTTGTYITNLYNDQTILAYEYNHEPIETKHGGPLRMIMPTMYLYKSAKWLKEIEFLNEQQLGFWEERGYSELADPINEKRYSSDD